MTREEAIKYIKSRCIGSTEERDGTQWSEAMWTAIEALAERPTESDFISKAKVLETYSELYWFDSDCEVVSKAEVDKIYERLQSLPSAEVVLQTPQTYGKSINPNTEIVSDLISRQDAIEAIASRDETDGTVKVFTGREVNEILSALPSEDRPTGWIPVSEMLPEEDTDVLISYRYKEGEGYTNHVYIDITSYGDMYFGGRKVEGVKHWRQPFEYFESNYEVIAWMPLPEPYREDGEE